MVVRARTIALLAVAASPLSAHGLLPAVKPPSFDCYSSLAGGTVDWSNGASLQPDLGIGSSLQPSAGLTYNPLSCAQSKFEQSFSNFSGDDMFAVKFEDKTGPLFDLKLDDFSYKPQNIYDEASQKYNTFFDLTLEFLKFDVAGNVLEKDFNFLGIMISSDKSFVQDYTFKFVNGELVLDPPVPDPNAVISLYATPQVTPEPGTLVLLGTGLLGIGTAMRKRLGW